MPIKILPDHVAAQIAAGEVVERPASVVKELVENALDAGATTIKVEVRSGGRELIRVSDDGYGIPADDALTAFARHATSKLSRIDDLDSLVTLGFRGEALASIASVSRVSMVTRHADEQTGTSLQLEGGQLLDRRSVGAPRGTVITVEHLFFNTPARLKFMKADATERRHIDSVITRYAMAYPNVRFSLTQDGRPTLSTTGNGSLADVLVETLGLDIVREMLPILPSDRQRADAPPIEVYGYTSTPTLHRNTRSFITVFVNGRHVQDNSLTFAICQAYHTLMPADRYPVAVILLAMPPTEVDVNVHPTKAEVRFRQSDVVFGAVQRAVRRAVMGGSDIQRLNLPNRADRPDVMDDPTTAYSSQTGLNFSNYNSGRFTQQIPPTDSDDQLLTTPESTPPERDEPPLEQRPRSLPPMRIVGQIAAMYIVAEGPAGMYLVDQHAAHERILYEQVMRAQAQRKPIAQQTLHGIVTQLPPPALRLLEEYADQLTSIGFEIEPFGGNSVKIRAVPSLLARREPSEALIEVLSDLESGLVAGSSEIEAQLVRKVCKAGAIKAGQILSYTEMTDLMRQLERCETPLTCPHGRPTLVHISAGQLAKEFGRLG